LVSVNDANDTQDDGLNCTLDACASGAPTHPPAPANTACGTNQFCDGNGACVGCTSTSQCGTATECMTPMCSMNTCGLAFAASGTPVMSQTAGDCQQQVCDGAGHIVAQEDNNDAPATNVPGDCKKPVCSMGQSAVANDDTETPADDGNSCTDDMCSSGSPTHPAKASGTTCNQNGGDICNGSGACVQRTAAVSVMRLSDGSGTLSNAAQTVYLLDYTVNTAGTATLGTTTSMPTSVSGPNKRLTMSGSASSEGSLSLSADGRFLVLTGYDANPGLVSVASTTSAANNRVVGLVDANHVIDTTTALTNAFTGNNSRSATSTDGSKLWLGGPDGVLYAPIAATTAVNVTTNNVRVDHVFDGQLYGTTSTSLFKVGTGTPTTTAAASNVISGISGASFYGFAFLDRNPAVAGVDTLYIADDTNAAGIRKFTFNGTTWTAAGTWNTVSGITGTTGFRGVTATVVGSSVWVFATTAGGANGGNQLVRFIDDGNATPTSSGVLATTATQSLFRGVALTPHN
jgi:hypothetical protein